MSEKLITKIAIVSLLLSSGFKSWADVERVVEASLFTMRVNIEATGSEDAFGDDINEYFISPLFKSKERVYVEEYDFYSNYHLGSPAVFLVHDNGNREKLYLREPVDVQVGSSITLEYSILTTDYIKEQSQVHLNPTDKDPHWNLPYPFPRFRDSDLIAFNSFDLNTDFSKPFIETRKNTVITYTASYGPIQTYTLDELLKAQQELFYIQNDYTKNHFNQLVDVLRGNLLLHTE